MLNFNLGWIDITDSQIEKFLTSSRGILISLEVYKQALRSFIDSNEVKYNEFIKDKEKEYKGDVFLFEPLNIKQTIEVGFRFKNCLRNFTNFQFDRFYFLVKKKNIFGNYKPYALLKCDSKYYIFDLKKPCNAYVEDCNLIKDCFYTFFEKPNFMPMYGGLPVGNNIGE